MEDVSIFYVHLVYFTAIWYIWLPFVIVYGIFGKYFTRLGMLHQEKSGNPALCHPAKKNKKA
jgi:hypothetical protein